MNNFSDTMSPVSTDGSEWSGINQYQSMKPEPPMSPNPQSRGALSTPPVSGGLPPPPPMNGSLPNGGPRRPSDSGNPSPPNSVTARSSDGTLSDQQSRRYRKMEMTLSQHYNVLKRFLGAQIRDEKGNIKSNKARDKLLRLSAIQFHELSTDVYDELLRRQAANPPPGRPPRADVPPYLLPRENFHEKRNQARQKLSSLQQGRFRDLATDVFCEHERRFPHFAGPEMGRMGSPAPGGRGRGPPPNGYGPPPPNGYGPRPPSNGYPGGPRAPSRGPPPGGRGYPPQGRFPPRQGSLGGPPPGVGVGQNGEPQEPLPKTFLSNTIVPNKSTMVEEDDDVAGIEDEYDRRSDAFALDSVLQSRRGTTTTLGGSDKDRKLADSQAQVSTLEQKIEELEESLKSKDLELSTRQENDQVKSDVSDAEKEEWESLRTDLENKVSDAQNLNSSLQYELDRVRQEQSETERSLREQLDDALSGQSGDSEWQARYEDLDRHHQNLQAELQAQREVTETVRQEASCFLQEMKVMSEQTSSNWEREEKLTREVQRLEGEVKEWKSRYARARAQLGNVRTSAFGLSNQRTDAGSFAKQHELCQPDGLVKDVHVSKFQISIDELLRAARSGEPMQILDQMKGVVLAVRRITHDIETSQTRGDVPNQLRGKVKTQVSKTANNLITASKNFANSNGLSPVSLLDAAASHLTTAVIDLIRTVKIRPTPADELEEDGEDSLGPMQSPGYFSVPPSQSRHSRNDSVYSAISSPSVRSRSQTMSRRTMSRNGLTNGYGGKINYTMRTRDSELEELKLYLEGQTEGLVQSIQALVVSVRAEDDMPTIRTHIDSIAGVVSKAVTATENSMNQPNCNPALLERAAPIVKVLASQRDQLVDTGAAGENVTSLDQLHEVTNNLRPIAFEIARQTKELVQCIDQIEFGTAEEEDDFR